MSLLAACCSAAKTNLKIKAWKETSRTETNLGRLNLEFDNPNHRIRFLPLGALQLVFVHH
jgi:hypothetical protein